MDLTLVLDEGAEKPLYQQVYEFFRDGIAEGRLAVGMKLPSVRQLSMAHHISKMTVETAYQQLLGEGYIESRPRSGFYVMRLEEFAEVTLPAVKGVQGMPQIEKETSDSTSAPLYNFHGSVVDLATFPMREWRRCMVEAMDRYGEDLAFYGHPQGEYELRVEIAEYLRQSRTVRCEPEQIIVGSGLQQTIAFLCLLLREDGQKMAWEDPGYAEARSVCNDHGWEVVPIPLEEDGIDLEALWNSKANAVLVTPAHQYPSGLVMPIGKRFGLLEWAKVTGGVIVEEDYDGEFRYGMKPVPSLQGLDTQGNVVYIGNFSKAFSPAIRMNYLVLSPRLLERYQRLNFRKYPSTVSRIEQRAMQLFMQKGHFTKHVRKMRQVYARKQAALVQALHEQMGSRVKVMGQSAGLHLLVEVDSGKSADELIGQALEKGVRVHPVEVGLLRKGASEGARPRILMGFGGLSHEEIVEGVRRLAEAWLGR